MLLQCLAWLGSASLVYGFILAVHAMRWRFGLAPVYVLIGFVASTMMWVSELGARVELGGITIMWGSTLFAGLMMAVFVLYVFDGSAAARTAIVTICSVTLMSYGLGALLHLLLANGFTEISVATEFSLDFRPYLASAFAAACDFIAMCIIWELLRRQKLVTYLLPRVFATLLVTLWLDTLLYVPLAYGAREGIEALASGNILDRLILSAWVSPALAFYFDWQRKLHGADLGRERVLSIIQRSARSEFELAMAREEIKRRITAEKALRESEEKFRTLIENIPGITFRCLIDEHWTMVYMSDAVHEITGYPATDFIQNRLRTFASVIHPDDAGYVAAIVDEAIKSNKTYSCGYRVIRADGEVRWLGERGQVSYDDEGKARWLDGVISDVTDRRAAEVRSQRYEFIANSVRDMMSFVNADYEYEAVNDAWCNMMGKSREAVIGRSVGAIWGNMAFYRGIQDNINRCLQGETVRFREWIELPARGRRYCETMLYPYKDEGRTTHAVIVTRDMTDEKRSHQIIEESERRFRAIFDQTGQLMAIINVRGEIQDANRAVQEFTGRGKIHWIGTELAEMPALQMSGKDGDRVREAVRAAIGGQTVQFETTVPDLEGDMHVFEATITPIRDESGDVEFLIASANDVTQRRRIEAALKESEEYFRAVFDNASIGIVSTDKDGGMIRANDTFLRILDARWDELRNQGLTGQAHPEDRAKIDGFLAEQAAGARDGFELEARYLAKDGATKWVDIRSSAIRDNDKNFIVSVTAVADVTERKEAEERVRESDLRIRRLVKVSPIAMAILDQAGGLEYANNKFTELFGYSEADVPNLEAWWPRAYPDRAYRKWVRAEWAKRITELQQHGQAKRLETRVTCNDGSERDIESWLASIGDGYIVLLNDLTERKRAALELAKAKEEAEAANRAKSDFLATMSHEIRTPMNAILGMVHLALRTELSEQQRDYLAKTQRAAKGLLGIINDILDFSKIEAGRMELEALPFDLDDVLNNLSDVAAARATDKPDLEILFRVQPQVPRRLIGDPLRLNQVLTNLVSNAIKFTTQGEIVVTVDVKHDGEDNAVLRFSVSDTGIGLSQEQIARLFRPFVQADSSTTRQYGGTGLGLTISKRLVNMMGGEIGVSSVLNEGSTFYFTANLGKQQGEPPPRWSPLQKMRELRVLVVDDNPTARTVLQQMLSPFTKQVVLAESGPEALRKLEENDGAKAFDLVLMDWRMPVMDGIETAQRMRNAPAATDAPVIILVTAYGREQVQRVAEEAGIESVLLKPLSQSTLVDAIMSVFGKSLGRPAAICSDGDGEAETRDALEGARVLLVEDNEINQQVAREMCRNVGLEVTVAENGERALALLEEGVYDAVLMDVQMPVMDGYEATRRIRAERRFDGLPVIAMTANTMAGDRDRCLEAGMDDHIGKPVDPKSLFEVLIRWIRAEQRGAALPALERVPERRSDNGKTVSAGDAALILEPPKALALLGENEVLYVELLEKFIDRYAEAPAQFQQFLNTGAIEEAGRLAHSVKGVAGYIAANRVQATCGALEACLAAGDAAAAAEKILAFETAMEEAIGAAKAYLAKHSRSDDGEILTGSLEELAGLLGQLTPRLRERRPTRCTSTINELSGRSWPQSIAPAVAEICALTKRYRYEEAERLTEATLLEINGARKGV